MGAQMATVIRNNLQNSGLFRSIPPGSFIEHNLGASAQPRFPDWRQVGAAGVVVGSVASSGGSIKVDFRLWDVIAGAQATGLSFTSQPNNWRRLSHIISDAIYKRVTGEEGYFDTRVAYVSETGPLNSRVKRIAIMDQDGANNRYITDGATIAITPRFSPTLQEIVYMAFGENKGPPRVYLQSVDSGRRELMGNFPGMSFAPRFSPDGSRIAMSLSQDGRTNLFEMDVRGRSQRRLTNSPAIDTSPCYSSDGTQIVFNSDRGGSQQLYIMPSGGGGERRDQLRRGPLCHAGVVAARRLHRLYQDLERRLRHRHHAARRQRRAPAGQRLPGRGADLGAQRPGADVLPPAAQLGRSCGVGQPQCNRRDRALRAAGSDADRCVGSGLVTLDSAVAKNMIREHDPSALSLGSCPSGSLPKDWKQRGARCENDA